MKLTERISKLSPAQRKLVLIKLREQGIEIDLSGLPGDTDEKSRGTASGTGLEPVEKKEYYALSSAQKRFYLLQYLETGSIAYNMTGVMVIQGKLHKQWFKEAARKLVTRHEALRTFIDAVEGEPRQRIQPGVEFEIDHYDAHAGEGSTEREKIAAVIRDFTRPFDLGTAPLLRMGLIKTEEETHIFLFDMHHIISDGTSMSMLVKDFTALYSGMRLPPLRIQYKDFCEWQDHLLTSGKLKKEEKYWLNTFSGDIPLLNMPTDYPRPSIQQFEGDSIAFRFEKEPARGINRLMRESGTTLYMVLTALFTILLSKYTRQYDIVIGSPIAGRNHPELENVIGLLMETIAARNYPRGDKSFVQFLGEVKENTLNAFENQDYPFRELAAQVGDESDRSRTPLFEAMLIVHSARTGAELEKIKMGDLTLYPYEGASHKISKVDLSLDAEQKGEEIEFHLKYCTKLFKIETMERFVNFFKKIAAVVVEDKTISLKDIKISHDLTSAASVYKDAEVGFDF